ncbi:MAG: TatD family hydrolase [Oceanospirillales bacterium]|nr:TatD family hydrolase [Oceanospirillales bacterium]
MLIDSHCHLDFPVFDANREQVLRRAVDAAVTAIVVPGVTARDWSRVLDLCTRERQDIRLFPALGLHPCFMSVYEADQLEALAQLIAQQRSSVVAVGEIGLDFQLEQFDAQAQLDLFEAQLAIARDFELPVLLHVRKAHDQVLKLLRRYRLVRGGIVHAFSGSEQQAREYAKLGFKLGFGGAISYSRATKLRRLAAQLPLEWIVLETDAPDMPLSQWRDQPNEPRHVADVAGIIAGLRGEAVHQIIEVTGSSATELLGLNYS